MLKELIRDVPQISQEHRNLLHEEISSAEVEGVINDAHGIRAPGPTGQTITFFKLLFQEIPGIFSAAINELFFNILP
jgi:hypothetical protein